MNCCFRGSYATMEPQNRKVVPMFKLVKERRSDFSCSKQYESNNCTLRKIEVADGSGEVNFLAEHHDLLYAPKMIITDNDILLSFHDMQCSINELPRIQSNLIDCQNFCKEFAREKSML